jgi:hypothetical protein
MGDPPVASPIECEGQRGLALRHRTGVMRDMNFRECPKGELRRISIPRTTVNIMMFIFYSHMGTTGGHEGTP